MIGGPLGFNEISLSLSLSLSALLAFSRRLAGRFIESRC